MNGLILRILPYLAAIVLFVGGAWWVLDSAYEQGRKMERLEWNEWLHDQSAQHIARIEERNKTQAAADEKRQRQFTHSLEVYANEIENLNADIDAHRDDRLFVRAEIPACTGRSDAGADHQNTEAHAGEATRVQLSAGVSADIWELRRQLGILLNTYSWLKHQVEDSACFEIIE